jgi:hypothetical protein
VDCLIAESNRTVLAFAWIHGKLSAMPRFRLRSLLLLIAFTAMALTALSRPSVYWAVFMPVIVMLLSVFGMCRAVSLPSKRVFWSSFLAGLFAYGASVIGIRILFKIWSENFDWTPQLEFWEESAWHALHGESPRVNLDLLPSGYTILDLLSFIVCLHVTIGITLSAIAAFIGDHLMRDRDQAQ